MRKLVKKNTTWHEAKKEQKKFFILIKLWNKKGAFDYSISFYESILKRNANKTAVKDPNNLKISMDKENGKIKKRIVAERFAI